MTGTEFKIEVLKRGAVVGRRIRMGEIAEAAGFSRQYLSGLVQREVVPQEIIDALDSIAPAVQVAS